MCEKDDLSLVQGVRIAAALVNQLDGGTIPPCSSTEDRITERRKGELIIERTVLARRNGSYPTIHVRRDAETLVRARLAPGWEDSNLRIEIIDYAADTSWISELADQRLAVRPRGPSTPIRLEKWQPS